MKKFLIMAVAGLLATGLSALAEGDAGAKKRPDGPRPEGPRMRPPLVAALDANSDGVIDADEINNAPAALKKLDKNGDGKLTREELMPPRPEGAGERRGEGRKGPPAPAKPQE